MEIKNIKISELKPAEYNPRTWSGEEMENLKESIRRFGIVDPFVVNSTPKRKNVIIGGHFRLEAVKQLGIEEVPVVYVDISDIKKEKELNLRLNRNLGRWDFDLLKKFDESLLKNVGFTEEELNNVFNIKEVEDNFDVGKALKEIKKPRTKLGELYQLGSHYLLCGNATNLGDINRLMNGHTAKLVFTSPPYNMAGDLYEDYSDNLKRKEFIDLHLNAIKNIQNFLKGFIFWNISYNKNARDEFIEIMYRIVKETGLKFLELIVWDKGHGMPINSKTGLTRQYEDILLVGDEDSVRQDLDIYFCGSNDRKVFFNKKNRVGITNYWHIGTNQIQLENLQACFPVALPRKGIELMTQREDIVVDIFGGSGTTIIACEELNRKCYMMELNPKYCDIIMDRFQKFTGIEPIKIEDNKQL